jgi:phosphate transport system substrate-binding protein
MIFVTGSVMELTGCGASAQTLPIEGSTAIEKVIGYLGEVYQEQQAQVRITYSPTGSGAGIQAVQEGRCEIGLSSRNLTEAEKETLTETILAMDGIVLLVHPDNPVTDLTMAQIAEIYTGTITNWQEVGGNDQPIVCIGRESASGTRDSFESITGTVDVCRYTQELTATGDVIQTVAANPYAIGYASLSADRSAVQTLCVEGVFPSAETLRDGTYRLQRPFLMITRNDTALSETAADFFQFAQSPEAEDWILKAGVVPPDAT